MGEALVGHLMRINLEYYSKFLLNVIPIILIELIAAITGSYYLKKKDYPLLINKYLVIFLWYTFFTEAIGTYAPLAFFSGYEYLGFVKNTLLVRNYWLYNIYFIISFSFLTYYFKAFLSNNRIKKTFNYLIGLYVITAVVYFLETNTFFIKYSIYTFSVGTVLLLISIILFYFELLKSDKVINLKRYLPIYISIGVLFFNLCVTPLQLFSKYFKSINELYVNLNATVLLIANIFMYSTIIIGFLVCSKKEFKN